MTPWGASPATKPAPHGGVTYPPTHKAVVPSVSKAVAPTCFHSVQNLKSDSSHVSSVFTADLGHTEGMPSYAVAAREPPRAALPPHKAVAPGLFTQLIRPLRQTLHDNDLPVFGKSCRSFVIKPLRQCSLVYSLPVLR